MERYMEGLIKGMKTRTATRSHHENAGCCIIFSAVFCSVLFCSAIISTQPPKSHFSRNSQKICQPFTPNLSKESLFFRKPRPSPIKSILTSINLLPFWKGYHEATYSFLWVCSICLRILALCLQIAFLAPTESRSLKAFTTST